jgi:predicted alpha/beta superfamily hydrolase
MRTAIFEITTMHPLPVGEQIFIAGNHKQLGAWRPDGLPLDRIDDLVWRGEATVPDQPPLEYKITRGDWLTEACAADETLPDNHIHIWSAEETSVTFKHTIPQWNDTRIKHPRIVGNYRVHTEVTSAHLRHARTVIVWLPPSYELETDRRYPVLYMQDGEQVFDPTTSTYNQDWEVDEWCTKLIKEKQLQEIIVVGVYSSPDRFIEYNPSQLGGAYVSFLTDELKPMIDEQYRTLHDRGATAIAGASMGGGLAFYAAWSRPDIFFGAACLSPAFDYKEDRFLLDLVKDASAAPAIKLYLYCGQDDELERTLSTGMHTMLHLLDEKGVHTGPMLMVEEDPQGQHNEASWARHTDRWLIHLFGNKPE